MDGRAHKCDNCGVVVFSQSPDHDHDSLFAVTTRARFMPEGWYVIGTETNDGPVRTHFCSVACLAFTVHYIYGKGNMPVSDETEV